MIDRDKDITIQVEKLITIESEEGLTSFDHKLSESGIHPLTANGITVLQVNAGLVCNQTCKHCHVDAGPNRHEQMDRKTFQQCLNVLDRTDIPTVDITGGSPELNPHFRWFVQEVHARGRQVMNRTNLTVIFEPEQEDLVDFLASHHVEVIASLPAITREQTDSIRGDQVFDQSINALQQFNQAGYGVEESDLQLHLVTNPLGAFLPGPQASMEMYWKKELHQQFGITFNNLYTMTNMPIGRFFQWLQTKKLLEPYMRKLVEAFNPAAAQAVMCRYTLSVDWQGFMYDCDFNQMLGLNVNHGLPHHIGEFDPERLDSRHIVTQIHCYGCTAGCGSSCGGAVI